MRIYQVTSIIVVPTCPKCGKLISAKKYKRHLARCGQTHRHGPAPIRHPENFYMNA